VAGEEEAEARSAATDCPMCGISGGALNVKCNNCNAILSLADVDAITRSREANEDLVKQAVERLQRLVQNGGAQVHINLAVAYLNLHNSQEGLLHLKAAAKVAPQETHLQAALAALQKRRLILIVDDSATVRKLVTSTLERNLYRTIVAADGMEALAKLNEDIPDLVLLDITMPRMGGYQVCKIIKDNATTKKVPVVMLSGNDGFFDKVKGRLAGATDYLTKPFEPSLLVKSLEKYLKK
jgi:twitching motility two-component system response regulator PilG